MEQAINAYYNITADSEFRERERLWSKARHDEAQAISNAEEKAKYAIAKNLISFGDPTEKIITVTGLSHEEVEKIRNS